MAAGEANVNMHETAFNPNRSLGFVKLRAYARQIVLRSAEGVVSYGKAGREDR